MTPSPSSTATGWTDDRVITLTRLWRDGLSASQIAKQLGGVTRNAVIGKIHRLGLSGRATPSAPRAPASRTPRPRRLPRAAPTRPSRVLCEAPAPHAAVPIALDQPGLVNSLVHLGPRACKWPIGDPKLSSFSFCGRPADGPYCTVHRPLARRPGTAWRADRDPVVRRALAGLA